MNDITKRTIESVNNIDLKEKCCIETSKDNKFLIRIEKDHKLRYIGSKYSVEKDVEKFYSDILQEANAETIFIVFGLGAGEHIKYLYDRITNSNKILIIEPSIAVIDEILKLNYINHILQDNRVALCYFDYGIRKNLNDFIEEQYMDNIKTGTFANYNIIFQEEYESMLGELGTIKKMKKMGDDTFKAFSYEFFNNFIENVFSLDEFYTVNRLKDLYMGKPAVIVSAGPSLTKNIHLLKNVQDKFIIICGLRTIGTLIKNGIKPDFLCSVDPQDEACELMKDCIDSEVPLVFMDSSSNKTVKKHKGLKIIAANQGMESYLEEMLGIKVDSIIQGGSVAHFCMGLAVYMGCSNVIFIGQDLAYTNEKFQAEGTYSESGIDELKYKYEKNKEEWDKDKNYSVYVPDIHGQMVRTSSVLNSYRQEFEDLIYSCDGVKFINSSQGGANIKGTAVMNLNDSIRICGKEAIDKNIEKLIGDKTILDEDVFIENMFKVIDKLELIKKACEEGLEYSKKMLHFYKDNKYCDINKVFSKLDKVDAIINDKKKLGFIAYKAASLINSILENDYYKERANESESELGIRLAKRSFCIYLAVLQTVEEAIFKIKGECSNINFIDSYNIKKISKLNIEKTNLNKFHYRKYISCNKNKNIKSMNIYCEKNVTNTLYKYAKKYNMMDYADVIAGDYSYCNEYLNVYTIKDSHNNAAGFSSTILFDKANKYADVIFVDYVQSDETYVYFNFIDDNTINFYEKVKNNDKKIEEYDHSKNFSYGFYVGKGFIGSYMNFYGTFIRNIIKKFNNISQNNFTCNNIIFDFNKKVIFINNVKVNMSEYVVDNYLTYKNLLIINTAERTDVKLIINKIQSCKLT